MLLPKYRKPALRQAWIFILCLCGNAYAQEQAPYEHLIPALELSQRQNTIVPNSSIYRDKGLVFLDSFREKTSGNRITRKIYEIVVAAPDSAENRNVGGASESQFMAFKGKNIRRIEVRRLNVFGANVDDPDAYRQFPAQKLLNSTHVNTNERIIRNNLLFSTGDTVSPVILSDNERLLRDLSFIDDARIRVIPVSEYEVDVIVITKDVYSIGGSVSPGITKGEFSVFDRNFIGMGQELGVRVPYDFSKRVSTGIGFHYMLDNIASSFVNMKAFWYNDLGDKLYGIKAERRLFSYETRYAGGFSLEHVYRMNPIDTGKKSVSYNLQDYWLSRSFPIKRDAMTRLIFGLRYTNNNVYDRPDILPHSYHTLQKYKLYLGSVTYSMEKYYKANLVYGYGRTEDIPYGAAITITGGREINEFKLRNYAASQVSYARSFERFGYVYGSASLGSFINERETEQGVLALNVRYFSPLLPVGRSMIRNFLRLDYMRGFDRNLDERLHFLDDSGFTGFRNDSARGAQRVTMNLETVVFSPLNVIGFRFAFFLFADISALAGTNQVIASGTSLSGIGLGFRIRNENLIFKTFQIRLGFFPNPPPYSRINYFTFSGEDQPEFNNFEPGEPALIPFR